MYNYRLGLTRLQELVTQDGEVRWEPIPNREDSCNTVSRHGGRAAKIEVKWINAICVISNYKPYGKCRGAWVCPESITILSSLLCPRDLFVNTLRNGIWDVNEGRAGVDGLSMMV